MDATRSITAKHLKARLFNRRQCGAVEVTVTDGRSKELQTGKGLSTALQCIDKGCSRALERAHTAGHTSALWM